MTERQPRCLDTTPELRPAAMDTLAAIVAQLGKKYVIFVPLVRKVLVRHRITHQRYDILYARVMQGGSAADFEDTLTRYVTAIARFPRIISRLENKAFICSETWAGLTLIWVFHHLALVHSRFCPISISPSRTWQTVDQLKSK